MLFEPIAVTVKVTAVLEALGVSYFIGGSLASVIYGMVRTTQDSDLVTELRPVHVESFVHALEGEFYIDEEMIIEAVARFSSFNIIHRESMFKVDVFIPRVRPFIKEQFARAHRQVLAIKPETVAYVSTAEDTLLSKLEWFRIGGEVSERQWRDVQGIIKVQSGSLDLDYLNHWANELQVSDLLERALVEAST